MLPLVDAAVHDLSMARTPGTFLHECAAAAAGKAAGTAAQGSMDELRLHNLALTSRLTELQEGQDQDVADFAMEAGRAREQVRRLLKEKRALEEVNEVQARQLSDLKADGAGYPFRRRQSQVCVVS